MSIVIQFLAVTSFLRPTIRVLLLALLERFYCPRKTLETINYTFYCTSSLMHDSTDCYYIKTFCLFCSGFVLHDIIFYLHIFLRTVTVCTMKICSEFIISYFIRENRYLNYRWNILKNNKYHLSKTNSFLHINKYTRYVFGG